ncbi:hypothetical protein [uncultured Olleya sp.]|uniref:hypothetical protein n=1 Tax=uncultured Olleya sp. TaxID=757243 RepID=UPI002594BA32|nr:hypothetical protein [uncultured Olleya sp.]
MKNKATLIMTIVLSLFVFISCSNDDDDSCIEVTWYEDTDEDGYGNENESVTSCNQPTGYVSNANDIDDTDSNLNPETVWQGEKITFTKANYADWTLAANQDPITENVIITRADNKGIFNIALETEFDNSSYISPLDTEWAIGSIADGVETLTFNTWDATHASNPQSILDIDLVLHLITDNIYIDIKVTSWSSGNTGGGFTYERSTMN